MTAIKWLLALLVLAIWTPAFGAMYYVDNNAADNSGVGSQADPWKELPGTASPAAGGWNGTTIAAGDTIYLDHNDTWTKAVLISSTYYADGTAGNPITISSDSTSTRAVFDFTDGAPSGSWGIDIRRNYVTVQYLEICNISQSGTGGGIQIGQTGAAAHDHVKVLHCYIHDIWDTGCTNVCADENYSYGIILFNRTNTEIGWNIIKNVDKKWIGSSEDWSGLNDEVHHNVMWNDASGWGDDDPMDHGITMSGTGGHMSVHDNILWNLHKYYGKCYAINMVEAGDYNKIYNNIIRGHTIGIVIRSSGTVGNYNEIIHNTIYLANCPMTYLDCEYGEEHAGIRLEEGVGHIVKNNLIYYPHLDSSAARGIVLESPISGQVVDYNLIYYDATGKERITDEGSGDLTIAQYNTAHSTNNAVADPVLSGGSYPVSNLPDGFDGSGYPNNTGLQLTSSGAGAMSGDATVGATYATDIQGNTRTNFNPGAYEYGAGSTPPSGQGCTIKAVSGQKAIIGSGNIKMRMQ